MPRLDEKILQKMRSGRLIELTKQPALDRIHLGRTGALCRLDALTAKGRINVSINALRILLNRKATIVGWCYAGVEVV